MKWLRCAVLWSLALGLFAPPSSSQAAPLAQAGTARVRFVNTLGDPYALNAYTDGQLWAGAVRDVAGYLDVPDGDHTFTFRLVGRPDDLASVTATLHDGERVTVAAINKLANLEATAIPDDVSAPPRGAARIKVVNAAPDAGPVTVRLDGTDLARSLAYGEASTHGLVLGGDRVLDVLGADGTALLEPFSHTFTGSRAYTLFLTGTAGQFAVLFADSTVLNPQPDTLFSFTNMAQGTGPLAVYVNGESVSPSVHFSSVTSAYMTGQGTHRVEVYPEGSGPADQSPLAVGSADLGPQQHMLFVAYGTARALRIVAYASDLGVLPPNAARLHVIHAAAGDPAIQVETLDGIELFPRVITEGDAVRVVPAGTYSFRFKSTTGEELMEKSGFAVPAGTVTLLIAVDDDPAAPFMNAVSVNIDNVPVEAAIRWANFSTGKPALDLYLDGAPVFTGLDYQQVTAYRLVALKSYTVAVYPAGSDPAVALPLATARLSLSAVDSPRTIYLLGEQVVPVPDRVDLLPPGKTRVRFVHTAQGVAAARVVDARGGATLVDVLPFGEASVYLNREPGSHAFAFEVGDSALSGMFDLEAGSVYTIILCGDASGQDIVTVTDTP